MPVKMTTIESGLLEQVCNRCECTLGRKWAKEDLERCRKFNPCGVILHKLAELRKQEDDTNER